MTKVRVLIWFFSYSRHYARIFMYYYLHIPFCRQKCPYCKFALTPVFDEFKKRRYIEHLKKEIREYFFSVNGWSVVNTIYFWWWTPSILSHDEIWEILECFWTPSHWGEGWGEVEISFECNPEDISQEYIDGLVKLGINRISLWVQTLSDTSLQEIHRSNRETIFHALECLSLWVNKISVNVDFILGLPFVSFGETLSGIQELHKKFPHITHTSVYMLEDEKYPKSWKENSLIEDALQKEFLSIMEYFGSIWWSHYELSNFSRPWYESVHNRWYWDHSDFRGFWLAASSYVAGKRWSNADSFSSYYKGKIENLEHITPEQKLLEKLMFSFRTTMKFDFISFQPIISRKKTDELIEKWLLYRKNGYMHVTKTWIFLLDHIMSKLI